jgi:taurine dioxygenase
VKTPEFSVRFSWKPGSIAIWDNRSTQHRPVNDYFPAHRRMERITIDGDRPY